MRPAIKTGSDIGNIFIKNSTNDQSATLAIAGSAVAVTLSAAA